MLRVFLSSVAALLLAACATPLPSPSALPARGEVREFALDARFSLTHEAERHAGRLAWRHESGGDEFRISSPFGQTVAEISFDARLARLVAADGSVRQAETPDLLVREVLGYPLPIDHLAGWVLARPRDGARVEHDGAGRPQLIAEEGWQITYAYDDEAPGALPARLIVTRDGGPELRLRIEEWRTP